MKIQVRRGAWETNSSSMHSVVITKNAGRMTQKEIRERCYIRNDVMIIDLDDNNYGWGFNILKTFDEKLDYALASYCGNCYSLRSYEESEKKFYEIFYPLLIKLTGVNDIKLETIQKSFNIYSDSITENDNQPIETYEEVPYSDLVGGECVDHEVKYRETCKSGRKQEELYFDVVEFGDVDHQSGGLLQGFLREYNISLEDFLVRKGIIVIIDNDNSCYFGELVESGLVDMKNMLIKYPLNGSYDWERYKNEHPEEFDEEGNRK